MLYGFLITAEEVAWRCSVKKVLLKISQNSQENTCARVSFLIKLQRPNITKNFRNYTFQLIDDICSIFFVLSLWNYSAMPNTIHSFLLSISWKVWTCSNFSINWNQLSIFTFIVQLVDFKCNARLRTSFLLEHLYWLPLSQAMDSVSIASNTL